MFNEKILNGLFQRNPFGTRSTTSYYEEVKIIDSDFALTEKEYENFKIE